jgi:hypothetical protein
MNTVMRDKRPQRPASSEPAAPIPLEAIQEAVASIRFGVVQLIIQDGRVVQIDKTEKVRLA